MSKENKNHLYKKAGIYAVTIILIAGAFVPTASSCHPGVKIEKTGPIFGYVGDEITYFFEVSNTGDMTLWGIGIEDDQSWCGVRSLNLGPGYAVCGRRENFGATAR